MRYTRLAIVTAACLATLGGCKAGKQREEILANQRQIQEELRKTREEILARHDQAKTREEELLRIARAEVTTDEEVLTLSRDTHQTVKQSSIRLEQVYTEVYGVGVDLRSAIGETRVVIAINNELPLRVHSQMPSSRETASEVVDTLPVGSVIFRAQKVTDSWYKGVVLKQGEQVPIYFAVKYTKPLREELTPESQLSTPPPQPSVVQPTPSK